MFFSTYEETLEKFFYLQIAKILGNIEPYQGPKCILYKESGYIDSQKHLKTPELWKVITSHYRGNMHSIGAVRLYESE